MNNRKLAIMQISPELLINLCKPGEHDLMVVLNALPEDARMGAAGSFYDSEKRVICIVVQSESFEEIDIDRRLPELPPTQFVSERSISS